MSDAEAGQSNSRKSFKLTLPTSQGSNYDKHKKGIKMQIYK